MTIDFYRPIYDEGDIWREESWTAHSAQEVPYDVTATVHVSCTYVDRIHYAGPNCPHVKYEE